MSYADVESGISQRRDWALMYRTEHEGNGSMSESILVECNLMLLHRWTASKSQTYPAVVFVPTYYS